MIKQHILLWLKAAMIRALKTFAQTAAALIPAAVTITEVNWGVVFGTAALAAVASLFTSLAGLPEVEYKYNEIEAECSPDFGAHPDKEENSK